MVFGRLYFASCSVTMPFRCKITVFKHNDYCKTDEGKTIDLLYAICRINDDNGVLRNINCKK